MGVEQYHQRIRAEKKSATLSAAMELFLAQGYKNTSLQQVAKRADVSTATLFKNFPTKASLLEAIVVEFWRNDTVCEGPLPDSDPGDILRKIGLDYARRMRQPEMLAFYRLVISEAVDFPDLGDILYGSGKGPVIERLESFLGAEVSAGRATDCDPSTAANQFLATIAGQAFWPELIGQGCGGTDEDMEEVVGGAAKLILVRYFSSSRMTA